MATVSVLNMEGKEVEKLELNDNIFGVEINEHLVHLAVVSQLANNRQGTQKAKTRSEVRGGGRKPWRQKGTGHARQGSIRAPQWKGGGVVFAPTPREYTKKLNKKERRIALKSALTSRVQADKFVVIDEFKFDEIKTKNVKAMLDSVGAKKALVVMGSKNDNLVLSARNLPGVKTALTSTINVYDILKYDTVVVSKEAVANIEEFIKVKSDLNKVQKANISVRVDENFMKAVIEDRNYETVFKVEDTGEIIKKSIDAKKLFKELAIQNWRFAEPGILFWDRISNWNLLSEDEEFEYAGTNPCAEEPLPAGGSCLLGSLILPSFVEKMVLILKN